MMAVMIRERGSFDLQSSYPVSLLLFVNRLVELWVEVIKQVHVEDERPEPAPTRGMFRRSTYFYAMTRVPPQSE